ncbi:MAG: DNA-3-methyladenine glycosylase I, partial [Candidatus Hodarchaeales archaeon]
TFNEFIWSFIDYKPINNQFKSLSEIPASTPLSEKISKDLKKRGFNFIGPTICYAYMQSIGMVNDHVVSCFCYNTISKLK